MMIITVTLTGITKEELSRHQHGMTTTRLKMVGAAQLLRLKVVPMIMLKQPNKCGVYKVVVMLLQMKKEDGIRLAMVELRLVILLSQNHQMKEMEVVGIMKVDGDSTLSESLKE
jgi:hypothetical protein